MNIMTQILCAFAVLGLIDKFFGSHWGIGEKGKIVKCRPIHTVREENNNEGNGY